MVDLSKITLCAISSVKIAETIKALEICQKECIFHNVIFFSDQEVINGVKIPRINNIEEYNSFVLHKLPKLILPNIANYVLLIHWDGFIINPESWTDHFYEYDYIGAPWPWLNNVCGNGGFSLRSKKFLEVQNDIISNKIITKFNEDLILCKILRHEFIKHGCIYAEPQIAYKFSTEHHSHINEYIFEKPFGFHDFKYNPQYKFMIS